MHQLPAHLLHAHFMKGELSAVEIAQAFLKRIEEQDPQIGAFLTLFPERTLEKARHLDKLRAEKKPLGKLAAVPLALKDNIHFKGEKTTCASRFLSNYKAVFDATATRLLEEAGAVIIGKTNMDEFAMGSSTENSAFHPTKNPWNLACTPGGSSGGSAAAVAARLTPLALGSDTGGSIRQPASLSGVLGFKPSYGRVSRYGLVAFGSSLDQIGPFATCAADIASVMEVMGKTCAHDFTSLRSAPEAYTEQLENPIHGKTIGIPLQFLENLGQEVRKNFDESLEVFKSLGCKVVEVDLSLMKYAVAVYYILATAEASTNLARFDGVRYGVRSKKATTIEEVFDLSRQEGFGPEVKRRIMLGTYVLSAGYQDAYYKKAQKVRTLLIDQFKEAFKKCDFIATPTSPIPAFERGHFQDPLQMYLQDIYTIPQNLSGLPAISIPCGFTKDKKPLGLHLTAPFLQDGSLMQMAHHFEKMTTYHKEMPLC